MEASDNEYVMYTLINMELGMGKGKMIAQAGHTVRRVTSLLEHCPSSAYEQWLLEAEPKVVLKARQVDLERAIADYSDRNKDLWCCHVRDAGRTQIPENSLTAVTFAPMKRNDRPEWLAALKLL